MNPSAGQACLSYMSTSPVALPRKHEFLVFRLADREYAIALEKVQELCDYDKLAPIANAPEPVAGTIVLGGRPIPVADMRALLSSAQTQSGVLADVIVLNSHELVCAIAVDCVIDVVMLQESDVTPAALASCPPLIGVVTLGQRLVTLLDVDKLTTDFHRRSINKLAA